MDEREHLPAARLDREADAQGCGELRRPRARGQEHRVAAHALAVGLHGARATRLDQHARHVRARADVDARARRRLGVGDHEPLVVEPVVVTEEDRALDPR